MLTPQLNLHMLCPTHAFFWQLSATRLRLVVIASMPTKKGSNEKEAQKAAVAERKRAAEAVSAEPRAKSKTKSKPTKSKEKGAEDFQAPDFEINWSNMDKFMKPWDISKEDAFVIISNTHRDPPHCMSPDEMHQMSLSAPAVRSHTKSSLGCCW